MEETVSHDERNNFIANSAWDTHTHTHTHTHRYILTYIYTCIHGTPCKFGLA
jgi:hypothetical protein